MEDGEQKPAPTVEGRGGSQKRFNRWNNRQHQKTKRKAIKDYRAPTARLEKELFIVRTASNVVLTSRR